MILINKEDAKNLLNRRLKGIFKLIKADKFDEYDELWVSDTLDELMEYNTEYISDLNIDNLIKNKYSKCSTCKNYEGEYNPFDTCSHCHDNDKYEKKSELTPEEEYPWLFNWEEYYGHKNEQTNDTQIK